jgi:hypothetical protein
MVFLAIAPIVWAKGAAAVLAFAATIPAVRVLSGQLRRLLELPQEWDPERLKGKIGITDVGEVRNDFGRALVPDGDQEHVVEVRSKGQAITPRGVKVLLVDFDSGGCFFWVEKFDETEESATP